MEVIVLGRVGRAGSVPVKNVLVSEGPKYRSSYLWAAVKMGGEILYRNPSSAVRVLYGCKLVFVERPIDSFAQGISYGVGLPQDARGDAVLKH